MKRVKVLVTGRVGHPDQRSGSYSLEKGETREDLPDEVVEMCAHVSDPPRVEILGDVEELDEDEDTSTSDDSEPESKTEDGGEGARESKRGRGGLFGSGKRTRGDGGKSGESKPSALE